MTLAFIYKFGTCVESGPTQFYDFYNYFLGNNYLKNIEKLCVNFTVKGECNSLTGSYLICSLNGHILKFKSGIVMSLQCRGALAAALAVA